MTHLVVFLLWISQQECKFVVVGGCVPLQGFVVSCWVISLSNSFATSLVAIMSWVLTLHVCFGILLFSRPKTPTVEVADVTLNKVSQTMGGCGCQWLCFEASWVRCRHEQLRCVFHCDEFSPHWQNQTSLVSWGVSLFFFFFVYGLKEC